MDPMLQLSTVFADQNQLVAISRITLDEIQMRYPNPTEDNSHKGDSEREDPQQEKEPLIYLKSDLNKYLSKFKHTFVFLKR